MVQQNMPVSENEKTFEYIFENIIDGVCIVDAETKKFSLGNRSMCQMLGYSKDELSDVSVYDIHPEGILPEIEELFCKLLHSEIEIAKDIPVLTKNGSLFYADISATPVQFNGRPHLVASFRNITDRKEAETQKDEAITQLRKSEARLSAFLEKAAIAIAVSKFSKFIFVNPQFVRMFGYDNASELIGRSIYDVISIKEQSKVMAIEVPTEENEIVVNELETAVLRRDGSEFWIHAAISDVYDYGSIGFITDITERKRAEEALRENEKKLSEFQKLAQLGNWTMDVRTGKVEWSDEIYKIFRLDPKEFIPHIDSIMALSPWPEYNKRDKEIISKSLESHEPGSYEQQFLLPDNSIGYYQSTFQGKYDDDGNLVSIVGTVLDITDLKRAEHELKHKEELLKATLNTTADGILLVDINNKISHINRQLIEMWKVPEEILDSDDDANLLGYVAGQVSDPAKFIERVEFLYSNDQESFDEVRFKDGRIFERYSSPLISEGNKFGRVWHFRDVTSRNRAEEALKESEEKYRTLIENMQDATYRCDLNGNLVFVSPSAAKILGYPSPEFMIGMNVGKDFYYYPEEREIFIKNIKTNSKVTNYEVTLKRYDNGEPVIVSTNSHLYHDGEKNIIGVEGVFRDITERKKAEEELCKSEERFAKAFHASPTPISLSELSTGIIISVNEQWEKLLGYTAEDATGRTSRELGITAEWSSRDKYIDQLIKDGAIRERSAKIRTRLNEVREVQWSAEIIKLGDRDVMLTVLQDITERKKAVEDLHKSEALLSSIIEASPAGILVLVGRVPKIVNRAFCRMTGYLKDEILDHPTRHLYFSDEEYNRVGLAYRDMDSEGLSMVETRFRSKEGLAINVLIWLSHINPDNEQEGDVAIVLDITDLKKVEFALKESEEKYRTIVDNMQDVVYRCDLNGNVTYISPSAVTLLGCISPESIKGKHIKDIYYNPADDESKLQTEYLMEYGKMNQHEVILKRMDNGEPVMALANSQFYHDKDGNILGIEGVYTDITRRKKAEEALKNSEAFLRKIFDVSPIGIVLVVNRVFVKVNGYICRMSGYSEEELLGKLSAFFTLMMKNLTG